MAKEKRAIVLYPAYFDAERSREDGRRVARKLSVNGPTVEEIAAAAGALGLKPKVEAESAHPSTPWRRDGRVLVRADYFKTSVVRKVAEKVKEARAAKSKGA
ncbi:MAG: signal recognition particle protein Srp19 [Methanobacteriota archaeon]|nr:MAG: signal recognition particle protein Srp19 [Euryarchaeota archaeon]